MKEPKETHKQLVEQVEAVGELEAVSELKAKVTTLEEQVANANY